MAGTQPNGAAIRARRKALKLSQEAVESLSRDLPPGFESVSSRTLRTAEKGGRIDESKLKSIAAVLEAPLESLIEATADAPFKGLAAFDLEDQALFGGRDAVIERVVAALADHNLAVVIGPSGGGKSSLCQAGALPRVLAEAGGPVVVIRMRPGRSALSALAAALAESLFPETPVAEIAGRVSTLRESLAADSTALATTLAAFQRRGGARAALYVDQAEELATQSDDAAAFLAQLAAALRAEDVALSVLMSARSDFAGDLLNLETDFAVLAEERFILLRRMTREELAEAIERPMKARSIRFEPALATRILADAAEEPGYLPHIQFVLKSLWDSAEAKDKALTLERYVAMGGVSGAIARHAEAVYERLSEAEQDLARLILPRLVAPQEHGRDVSARRRLEDFSTAAQALIEKLAAADARILHLSVDDEAESVFAAFAHEEILRQWPALRAWIAADAEAGRQRERLERDIALWREHEEHSDFLVPPGRKLAAYEALLTDQPADALPTEAARFVAASKQAYGLFNRRFVWMVSAATATALAAALVAFVYPMAVSWRQDLAREAARTGLESLSLAKELSAVRDRRYYFADWPERRIHYGRLAANDAAFYDKEAEIAAFRSWLATCPRDHGIAAAGLELRTVKVAEEAEGCGVVPLIEADFRHGVLTATDFSGPVDLTRADFLGARLVLAQFAQADLTDAFFACAVVDGADFSQARNFAPSAVSRSLCLYPAYGAPILPDGAAQPEGCAWIPRMLEENGWTREETHRAGPEMEAVINAARAEAVDTFYYGCLADNVTTKAYLALIAGEAVEGLRLSQEALAFETEDANVLLNHAHALAMTGDPAGALAIHRANRDRRFRDGRDWPTVAKADLAELTAMPPEAAARILAVLEENP